MVKFTVFVPNMADVHEPEITPVSRKALRVARGFFVVKPFENSREITWCQMFENFHGRSPFLCPECGEELNGVERA